MRIFREPVNVIDDGIYHVAFDVDGKIVVLESDKNDEYRETMTIYDTMDEYLHNAEPPKLKTKTETNSLFLKVIDEVTDYDNIDITDDEFEILKTETIDIYDRDDLELTINKKLLDFGFIYDVEVLKWLR